MSDYSALATAAPAALVGHLANLGDNPARQAWINQLFDDADETRADGLYDLAWAANDIAVLLNQGADPASIRRCPYRGIVAGLDDEPMPAPARPDRSAPGYVPPEGFKVAVDGSLEPELPPFTPDELTEARIRWDVAARRQQMDLPPLTEVEQDAAFDEDGEPASNARFPILSASQLAALEPGAELVKGILPAEGTAAVYGPSASGKSFLALDLLIHVAAGRAWFGYRVRRAVPVLLMCLEGQGGLSRRVRAWIKEHGPLPDNLQFCLAPLSLNSGIDRQDLIDAAKGAGYSGGILVIDTLSQAAGGCDENAPEGMGALLAGLGDLQREMGGLVLLIHHTGKDLTRGLRGHSSLFAALDAAIEVTRSGDSRAWLLAKSKDGPDGESHPFKLAVVELGIDDDGEPITSCVIRPDTGDSTPMTRRPSKPKTGNRAIVYEQLGGLLRAAGCVRPEGAPENLPNGRPAVSIEAAVEAIKGSLPVEPRRQAERCRSALASLIAEGHFISNEGFIWCP